MRAGLTPRQADCLAAIKRLTKANGVAPSHDELCAELGIASRSGVHRYLHGLQERGYVELLPHRRRSIRVIEGDA